MVNFGLSAGFRAGLKLDTLLSSLLLAAVGQNLALDGLLGLCPMVALSRKFEVASGMAVMTVVLLPVLCVAAWLIQRMVLVPNDAEALGLLAWVLLSFLLVGIAGVVMRRWLPGVAGEYEPYLPFFGINCLVLGALLSTLTNADSLLAVIGWAVGSALGYAAVLLIVTCLRERLEMTALPRAMRGAPALVLSVGLLALAMSGLRGVG